MTISIRVQFPNHMSVSAAMDDADGILTFIAYSDEMKARILEQILLSNEEVILSVESGGLMLRGEWKEPAAEDGKIFNGN